MNRDIQLLDKAAGNSTYAYQLTPCPAVIGWALCPEGVQIKSVKGYFYIEFQAK